jgi:hypothetical protein
VAKHTVMDVHLRSESRVLQPFALARGCSPPLGGGLVDSHLCSRATSAFSAASSAAGPALSDARPLLDQVSRQAMRTSFAPALIRMCDPGDTVHVSGKQCRFIDTVCQLSHFKQQGAEGLLCSALGGGGEELMSRIGDG